MDVGAVAGRSSSGPRVRGGRPHAAQVARRRRTPPGRRRRSPSRSTSTGRDARSPARPRRRARSSRPRAARRPARAPASSSARANIAPPGFASPISADVSDGVDELAQPGRAPGRSCSETSQLLTTTSARPRREGRAATSGTSANGRKRSAARSASSSASASSPEAGAGQRGAQDLACSRARSRASAVAVRRDRRDARGSRRSRRAARSARPRRARARRAPRARPRAAGTGPRARPACRARRAVTSAGIDATQATVTRPSASVAKIAEYTASPIVAERQRAPARATRRSDAQAATADGEREQHEQEAWQRHERLGPTG